MTERHEAEPSFDPRTWATPQQVAAPPSPSAGGKGPWIAGGVGALLIVSAAALLLGRGSVDSTKPAKGERPASAESRRASNPGSVRRRWVVVGMPDLEKSLQSAGFSAEAARSISMAVAGVLRRPKEELRIAATIGPPSHPELTQVDVRLADGSGARATYVDGVYRAAPLTSDVAARVRVVRGEMDANSFYSSAVAAGVTDQLIPEFAAAFVFDFDFQREIRPGDIFEAVIEEKTDGSGQRVGVGRLLYASLQTAEKSRALYRFQPPGESQPSWFDGNGRITVRSLMRTPVEGARVSSSFGSRVHPVLGYTRVHKGTDFATPIGTPVYASGDGVVDFMGPHGGHGNFVRIRHSNRLETGYAHLSTYAPLLKVGSSVTQGQVIAASGNTGLSSGPHLHYEVIVDGSQVDPMTFQTEVGRVLKGPALATFTLERDRMDALRAQQGAGGAAAAKR